MKFKYIFGLLSIALVSFSACNKHNGCAQSEAAIVNDFSDSDSCGTVFELVEDGTYLEATNLNQFKNYEDGDLVWISYKPTAGASECELGEIVKIRCVVDREF